MLKPVAQNTGHRKAVPPCSRRVVGKISMLCPVGAVTPAKVTGWEVAGVWPCWIDGTTGQMALVSLLLLLLIRNASKRRGSKLTSVNPNVSLKPSIWSWETVVSPPL